MHIMISYNYCGLLSFNIVPDWQQFHRQLLDLIRFQCYGSQIFNFRARWDNCAEKNFHFAKLIISKTRTIGRWNRKPQELATDKRKSKRDNVRNNDLRITTWPPLNCFIKIEETVQKYLTLTSTVSVKMWFKNFCYIWDQVKMN